MKPDAPVLLERLFNATDANVRPGGLKDDDDSAASTNVANHFVFEMGDIEQGFKEADVVIEREYRTQSVHQGYIEPHTSTADWNEEGSVTVWSSSQGHFNVRDQVAMVLDIPISKIKAIPMEIGGGFGGKTLVYLEPVAVLLSQKSGAPVKLSMNPLRGVPRLRPHLGKLDALQVGRHQRRPDHRDRRLPGLRGWRIPGFADQPRDTMHDRPLRHRQRQVGRL